MIADENSPPDYTGLHWLSCQLHITIWLEWIWNRTWFYKMVSCKEQWNCQNGQNGKWSNTLMKSIHWKNGMVKMDKIEYGPHGISAFKRRPK